MFLYHLMALAKQELKRWLEVKEHLTKDSSMVIVDEECKPWHGVVILRISGPLYLSQSHPWKGRGQKNSLAISRMNTPHH